MRGVVAKLLPQKSSRRTCSQEYEEYKNLLEENSMLIAGLSTVHGARLPYAVCRTCTSDSTLELVGGLLSRRLGYAAHGKRDMMASRGEGRHPNEVV